MSNSPYKLWDDQRGVIRTRIGGWKIGKGITTYGYSLMDDLVVLILNITGKMPEKRLSKWIEAIYSCLSFPDPRIWCNQVGTLAGNMRTSPVSGITSGVLASDSRMYGPGTAIDTSEFLSSAMNQYHNGVSIPEIVDSKCRRPGSKPIIPGFGRPIATGDERVVRMNKVTENLGFQWGPYMLLAREIDRYMFDEHGENMNFATFIVAFLRDQQWDVEQIRQATSFIVTAGVAACYSEAYEKPAETFLSLRCVDIDYRGVGPRVVPEKD